MRRSAPAIALVLWLSLSTLGGCGDGGSDGAFEDCGNGVLDSGEVCDDGNQLDVDGCLATCVLASCGDSFVNDGVEQCEVGVLGAATCHTQGFASGSLGCDTGCRFDTSGCSGSGGGPTPTATPIVGPTVTPFTGPTATAIGPIPTATPTPGNGGGGSCDAGEVVVVASLDAAYGAARLDLSYPSTVLIPGTGTAVSVGERVAFAADGITTVSDDDNAGILTASLVSLDDNPAGTFATIRFDCVSGQPSPEDFVCTVVSAATPGGVAITDLRCLLTLQ